MSTPTSCSSPQSEKKGTQLYIPHILPYPRRIYSAKTSVTSPLNKFTPSIPKLSKKSTVSCFSMDLAYFSILDVKHDRELQFLRSSSHHLIEFRRGCVIDVSTKSLSIVPFVFIILVQYHIVPNISNKPNSCVLASKSLTGIVKLF